MKVFIISSLLALSSAFPQTGTNLCGVNERGLPRQAGDRWKEDCNRCRCTDNLLPGCTKRFCNIPAGDIIKPAPGTSVRGFLLTGGDRSTGTSTQIISEDGLDLCFVEDLPEPRSNHTTDNTLTCGGIDTSGKGLDTCITLNNGSWTNSHQLLQPRWGHSSWATKDGVLLIGGYESMKTTELVKPATSTPIADFTLKYDTRFACSIGMNDKVIITGGEFTTKTVSVYTTAGWDEDLVSLNNGRYHHACGYYSTATGDIVYLVTGGFNGSDLLSSTEIYESNSWVEVEHLPSALQGPRVESLKNVLILTGGLDNNGQQSELLLKYDASGRYWVNVGSINTGRHNHGMSTINTTEACGISCTNPLIKNFIYLVFNTCSNTYQDSTDIYNCLADKFNCAQNPGSVYCECRNTVLCQSRQNCNGKINNNCGCSCNVDSHDCNLWKAFRCPSCYKITKPANSDGCIVNTCPWPPCIIISNNPPTCTSPPAS